MERALRTRRLIRTRSAPPVEYAAFEEAMMDTGLLIGCLLTAALFAGLGYYLTRKP